MTTISPESFSFMESVVLFLIVILGGSGQYGVILGAFLFIGLPEVLARIFASARMLIFGLAMMFMMIWRPQGCCRPGPKSRYGTTVPPGPGQ
jgi:branched-chain amino acid transport system permease protein